LLINDLHKYNLTKIEKQLQILRKSSTHAYELIINLLDWAMEQIKYSP